VDLLGATENLVKYSVDAKDDFISYLPFSKKKISHIHLLRYFIILIIFWIWKNALICVYAKAHMASPLDREIAAVVVAFVYYYSRSIMEWKREDEFTQRYSSDKSERLKR
jgi:hypothetical protein